MGLGLESANLEHTASFAARFREAGDEEGARVQELVGREEIAHVRFGVTWFETFAESSTSTRGAARCRRRSRRSSCAAARCSAKRAERPDNPRLPRRARSMAARFAWVLNLDADLELAHGEGYTPTASVRAPRRRSRNVFAASLVGADDFVVDGSEREGAARGLIGRAFCPTPRAIAMLVRAGAEPEPHPSFEVLRRVNSRAFAASLGQTMPKAAFVTNMEEAREILRGDPAPGHGWRIKRAFGMSGRFHRIVDREPHDENIAFLQKWIDEAGVQIEPNVKIEREYAQHGFITNGAVRLGALTEQRTDASGAWIATELAIGAPSAIALEIERETERAGRALANARYFGPFNVDAFEYDGTLRARSEVNARYSLGFAIGFGR